MTRPTALAPLVVLLAACQVTVVPSAGKPGTPVVTTASAKPGPATPRPGPSASATPREGGEIVPGLIDEVSPPGEARLGEEVRLAAQVILNDGCTSFVDAQADADHGARRVTITARVRRGPPEVGCTLAIGHARTEIAFTPRTAGTWTIVAPERHEKPLEWTLEVLGAGATPGPTAAPTATPAPGATPDAKGWTAEALRFSRVTPPVAAKSGVATAIAYVATIGSSSCARFEAASAEVDAATKTVRLAGTKRVAPPGSACTKDLRSHEGEAAVTLPAAGTWTITAPGATDTPFEVAP